MQWFKSFFSVLVIITVVLLIACDTSILSDNDILRLQDTIAPVITLKSPRDGGYYAASIVVEGTVTDAADSSGSPGKVASLYYKIEGTVINRQVSLNEDGTFGFFFGTDNMTGSLTLTLTASDWNGMTGIISITLKQGAFPGFHAVPGNEEVTLNWQPAPFAAEYTIYYKKDSPLSGTTDYDRKIENAVSPQLVDDLQNGALYSFMIQAHSTTGSDNFSGIVQAVPVSPFTFAPNVTGAYKQIIVEWPQPGTTMKFTVTRSEAKEGFYNDISGPVTGSRYIDTNVIPGIHYYYKVTPSLAGSLESAPNFGECVPFSPFLATAGIYKTPSLAGGMKIAGRYLFIADAEAGLLIVDISSPETPVLTGSCALDGSAHAVALDGNHAYVAADSAGMYIIDISTLSLPRCINTYDTTGNAVDVAVNNGYAYVADSEAGLVILDVGNPIDPQEAASYTTENSCATGITLVDNKAYIACGPAGLQILDISDPVHPLAAGSCDTPYRANKVAVKDGFAYVADGVSGLQIISLGKGEAPPVLFGACQTGSDAIDIAVEGNLAFIADKTAGLILVDVSDKFFPVIATTCPGIEHANSVITDNHYAYVRCYTDGIHILNIARPGISGQAAVYNAGGKVLSTVVQGDYALMAADSAGLEIADIADRNHPRFLSNLPLPGAVGDIAICGDYAFLTGVNTGLQIVCFLNPAVPVLTGAFELPGITAGICIRGDYAFIAYRKTADYSPNSRSGLQILNIAHPENPRSVSGYMESSGSATGVTVAGNYAYLLNQEAGIMILDITDIKQPSWVKTQNTNGSALRIAIRNNTALVADGTAGIWAANILNPGAPLVHYSYYTGACAQDIRLVNDYAFIANGQGGLLIINTTDLLNPFKTGTYVQGTPETKSIAISGSYSFLVRGSGGLSIIDLWPYN